MRTIDIFGGKMRLYSGQVSVVAQDLLKTLMKEESLEVLDENRGEVEEDIQSVLREYIRLDREITDRARDASAQRSSSSIGREKRRFAKQMGVSIAEDPVGYIIQQLIETFFHSHFVDEVYSDDNDLRRIMAPVLKKHMTVQQELDQEVRDKIKNLEEGSAAWDIEYQRAMENLKRAKKLED